MLSLLSADWLRNYRYPCVKSAPKWVLCIRRTRTRTADDWCTNRHRSTKAVHSQRQSKQQKMTIGVPIVTGLPSLYQQCTNRQKQSNSKMTIGVPIITCLHRVRWMHKVCVRVRRPRPPNTQSPKMHYFHTKPLKRFLGRRHGPLSRTNPHWRGDTLSQVPPLGDFHAYSAASTLSMPRPMPPPQSEVMHSALLRV